MHDIHIILAPNGDIIKTTKKIMKNKQVTRKLVEANSRNVYIIILNKATNAQR